MRLVLLILGAVVAQVWHEDDPQDDATRQLWFEEAREAVLDMDENFAASYDARASASSHAAVSDRRRWRRAGAGRIVRVQLTSSPGPGPHRRRHASRQATRQNWPFHQGRQRMGRERDGDPGPRALGVRLRAGVGGHGDARVVWPARVDARRRPLERKATQVARQSSLAMRPA